MQMSQIRHEALLGEREAASRLGVSVKFLQTRRWKGGGPRYVKLSAKCIKYRPSDLASFCEERLRTSTSDSGEGK